MISYWKAPGDLRKLFSETSEQYILINCLFHQDDTPSMAIYEDHAYCFGACHRWYGYWEVIKKIKGENFPRTSIILKKKEQLVLSQDKLAELIEQFHKTLFLMKKDSWFYGRGISKDSIKDFKLGYTGRAFSIPILDTIENPGHIWTIRFRRDDSLSTRGSKYWGIPGLNSTCLFAPLGIGERIIWVEGELDAILAGSLGYFSVTSTGGVSNIFIPSDENKNTSKLEKVKEIIIALDQDKASYSKSLELAAKWREVGKIVKIARFPEKDITDLFLKRKIEGLKKYLGEP